MQLVLLGVLSLVGGGQPKGLAVGDEVVVVEPVVELVAGQCLLELRHVHGRKGSSYFFAHYLLQFVHQHLELTVCCCLGILGWLVVLLRYHLILALLQSRPVCLTAQDALLKLRAWSDEQILHLPVDLVHVYNLI